MKQLPKITLAKLKFRLNPGLFLWCRSESCRDDLLLFHRRPLWLAASSSWWNIYLSYLKTDIWFKNKLDKNTIPPISTGLWKTKREFWKPTALILIKLSHPDPKRSTRGNCRVPLNESQFFETHPEVCKTFGILVRLKNGTLPFLIS